MTFELPAEGAIRGFKGHTLKLCAESHSGVQRSYVKIVRGEGEPGDEATLAAQFVGM